MTKMRNDVRTLVLIGSGLLSACGAAEASQSSSDGDNLMGAQIDPGTGSTPSSSDESQDRLMSAETGGGFKSSEEPIQENTPLPTVCPEGKWCSTLYPPTWTPAQPADAEGRFMHDFSYAGYHHGDAPPAAPGAVFDVVAGYAADASGGSDASAAVQAAINAAQTAGGGVVYFPAGTYRLDRTVNVSASNVVLRGAGTSSVLRGTNGTAVSIKGSVKREAARPLAADGANRSNEVVVADASGLAVGDDVSIGWTITPAFIGDHGMNGVWTAFNGKYQTFFRATIAAIEGNKVILDTPLRYPAKVRDGAALQKETGYLKEVGLESLAVTNATSWSQAWQGGQVSVVVMSDVTDGWVRDVHSVATPGATGKDSSDSRAYHLRNSGLRLEDSKRVTVMDSSMENPQNRGEGGAGYLFEVIGVNEVLFKNDVARNGRHNFIQSWGFGTSGMVFLRCVSEGAEEWSSPTGPAARSSSETHHSLAMATLVDDSRIEDGFNFQNRREMSQGAGHTATESVVWRASGAGRVASKQYGWGYVIGTAPGLTVDTSVGSAAGTGSAPEDFVEGKDQSDTLWPPSIYEHQRARRLQAK